MNRDSSFFQEFNAPKTFHEILNEHGYDAVFWAKALAMYWYDRTGQEVDWLATPAGADLAYRLCWEFSDCGMHRNIYEMFDLAAEEAFPDSGQ
ncbi:hypothetical protein ACFOQN_01330 [Neisseria musculi]